MSLQERTRTSVHVYTYIYVYVCEGIYVRQKKKNRERGRVDRIVTTAKSAADNVYNIKRCFLTESIIYSNHRFVYSGFH